MTETKATRAMKIPKNQQSRLTQDVWIAGEAIARHRGMMSSRDAFETAVRDFATRLSETDENFKKLWDAVKAEWDAENTKEQTSKPEGGSRK